MSHCRYKTKLFSSEIYEQKVFGCEYSFMMNKKRQFRHTHSSYKKIVGIPYRQSVTIGSTEDISHYIHIIE